MPEGTKSSDRRGHEVNYAQNSTGKIHGDFYQVKQKKKKTKRDNNHQTIGKAKDMSQTTSPMQLRQYFKKKKSKNKLSGILNISSAHFAVKGCNFKLSQEKPRDSFHLVAINDTRMQPTRLQQNEKKKQKTAKKQATIDDYMCNQKLMKGTPHVIYSDKLNGDKLCPTKEVALGTHLSSGQYRVMKILKKTSPRVRVSRSPLEVPQKNITPMEEHEYNTKLTKTHDQNALHSTPMNVRFSVKMKSKDATSLPLNPIQQTQ